MLRRATSKSNQQGKQGGEVSVIIHPRPRLVKPLFLVAQMVVRCFLLMPTKWFLHHFREATKMVCRYYQFRKAPKMTMLRMHEKGAVQKKTTATTAKKNRVSAFFFVVFFFLFYFYFFYFFSFYT